VRTHAESNGRRDEVAVFVKVADREYGVANDSNGRPGARTRILGERRAAVHLMPPAAAVGESRTVMTAWAGIAASVVAVTLILVGPGHWPALAGALLLACVPVGAAVMCWFDCGDGFAQAGLTLVLSLAVTAIVSALMIWLATWHPSLLLAAFPAVSIVSCVARLRVLRGAGNVAWRMPAMRRDLLLQLALLFIGLGAWAYGVSQMRRQTIGSFGLLASANVWFFLGLAVLVVGGLLELSRPEPRSWLLCTYLAALIVAIDATVPILYGVPEYAWVYKHIGIAQALGRYGRVTDPSNIYQQWPALFAAVASVSGVARIGPLSFAAWGPLVFELADALLLLGVFRLLGANRRVAFLALFLYEGLIAWVGQDYLSPQAFGYLLWLGIVTILVRWLLAPAPVHARGVLARVRAPFLVQLPVPHGSTRAGQAFAATLIAVVYFAIVAAHQLTPYMAIAGVGALALLGVVRRGWLLLLILVVIAGGYLGLHYSLISQEFGGLFSGGNALENASGVSASHHGAEAMTAVIVRALAVCMWLLALIAIVRQRRAMGRVSIAAALAFSPFIIVFVQNYGGEAIYRVFLFSAPWCALLIAGALVELRVVLWQRLVIAGACSVALAAGLQGLYGPVAVDSFTPAELAASQWLYSHAEPGSVFVLPADSFPMLETANYHAYSLQVMPADPQVRAAWLDEADVTEVEAWIDSLGRLNAYVVFSRSMAAQATYFGAPRGYTQLASAVRSRPGWSVVYRNADTTIYRVHVG
jgi:hypothetical protein